MPDNTAPPWVLPRMRLMTSEGDWARAWRSLPDHQPEGVQLPDAAEAATILVRLKLF